MTVHIPSSVMVGEGDGLVQICATLSAIDPTERNFTTTLMTTDGTGKYKDCTLSITLIIVALSALDISDYLSGHFLVTFPTGSIDNDAQCVHISIINDTALEGDQTFTLSLSTTDSNVLLGTNLTTVTITDNDG